MPSWAINTLGDFILTRDDRQIAPLGRKGNALLAYLLASRDVSNTRAKLAGLLWADRGDEQARQSLRQCVLTCRKALDDADGNILTTDGDHLKIEHAHFDVDAAAFASLSAEGSPDSLREAMALYKGEFLSGFPAESDEFEVWLRQERRKYADMAVDALRQLMHFETEAKNHEAAIAWAKWLLEIDPLNEAAYRCLMRAYYETGRRAEALRQYQDCAETLQRELQAEPERETRELHDRILADDDRDRRPDEGRNQPKKLGWATVRQSLWRHLGRRCMSRRAAYTLATVVLAGVLVWIFSGEIIPPDPIPDKVTIVVLPYKPAANNTADKAMAEVLAEGLTEGITTGLSLSPKMVVVGSGSAHGYRDLPLERIAKELKVRYVVKGNVSIIDGTMRTAVKLFDTHPDIGPIQIIWGDQYDRGTGDIFELLNEITMEIVTNLNVELTEGEQARLAHVHGTKILKAWIEAGRALKAVRLLTRKDNAIARFHYEQAIELDPDYSTAWAGLAWTHFLDARFGWTAAPEASVHMAWGIAQKAFQIDPKRPRTHALLGSLNLIKGNHEKAIELGLESIRLGPNAADARAFLALTYTYTGDSDKSIDALKEAMRLSPTYPDWYRWCLGRAYRLNGRYLDAERELSVGLYSDSVSIAPRVELVQTLMSLRRLGAAWNHARIVKEQHPRISVRRWVTMPPYKDPEQAKEEARLMLEAGLPE